MKIFVVHYKKLVARRQALEQRLREEGLEAQFVDQYDRDTITSEDRRLFDNGIDWLRFRRRMAPVQVAISLSHALCFREAADLPTPTLVLEDDALLAQGFAQGLARCLADLSSGWDLLFLGDGCGFHIPQAMQVAGKSVHPKGREATPWGGAGATRCTDSYVMTPRAAAELRRAVASGDVHATLRAGGFEPEWDAPDTFAQTVRSDATHWQGVIRQADLRLDSGE
jgi:GR25 family glycosyltransferase involved in LPS biosynthesis